MPFTVTYVSANIHPHTQSSPKHTCVRQPVITALIPTHLFNDYVSLPVTLFIPSLSPILMPIFHAHTPSVTCFAHTHACTLGPRPLRPPHGVAWDLQPLQCNRRDFNLHYYSAVYYIYVYMCVLLNNITCAKWL